MSFFVFPAGMTALGVERRLGTGMTSEQSAKRWMFCPRVAILAIALSNCDTMRSWRAKRNHEL